MSVAEAVQKVGMDGVDLVKRWLESTTWIELPFNVYDHTVVCTLDRLDGKKKRYDLFGFIHRQPAVPLYVEVKNYDSSGGKQAADYWEFLANAYSITANDLRKGPDGRREFAWVTRYPFAFEYWAKLTSAARVQEALGRHPEALGDKTINADVLKLVSDRLWLLMLHKRQEDLMLTPQELASIEGLLNRKGKK